MIVAGNQPGRYWSVFFWCDFDGDAGRWMWWWLWCDKWYLLLWTKRILMVVIFVTKWKNCKKKTLPKNDILPRSTTQGRGYGGGGGEWYRVSFYFWVNWEKECYYFKILLLVQFYAFINNFACEQWAFFCRMATLAWLYLSLGHQFEIDKIKLTNVAHLIVAIVLKTINTFNPALCFSQFGLHFTISNSVQCFSRLP